MNHRAFIALGSNLGDRQAHLERAAAALCALGVVSARSAFYRSPPWGVLDQPEFLNAVVLLQTACPPHALLDALLALEETLGRRPAQRWGPRCIDLDLLLYDDLQIDEPALSLPHPRMWERAFVLVPLAEIEPSFIPARDALARADLEQVVLAGCFRRRSLLK
ncbi:MAG: 2-amino-4-hydroxy-6-hydroxymethyldihydropteridine diphosphokinase [Vulcanimicrobiaceae bacterium]